MTCRAVIQEQHVKKRFVKFNTLYTHIAPTLSMILLQQWKHHTETGMIYIEHEFDNFKEYTVHSPLTEVQ